MQPLTGQAASSQLRWLLQGGRARLTNAAQLLWAQMLQPGDVCVDATCGNGNDTLFLANAVGPSGTVHAIDIQQAAVDATKQCIEAALPAGHRPTLHLHRSCHSRMQELVGSNVASLVCLNLGYLPKADKAVTTTATASVAAVEAAFEVVRPGGLISVMCYTGHPGKAFAPSMTCCVHCRYVASLCKGLPRAD